MTTDLRDRVQAALGGSYTLERELGGGMSRVFVARERALDRDVVVKVLPPELAADVDVERFAREVGMAARLSHPHIVPLLSAGEVNGITYYTMPLVRGETLRVRLHRDGALPIPDAIHILRGIADALVCAHAAGVVHRDIKPENVLLVDRHALVTDFGVAKALTSAGEWDRTLTARGIAVGTPTYMAPEQASADPSIDHRADVYAFGALAYELLTGQPPFVGPTAREVMLAHTRTPARGVEMLRTDIPVPLARLVMQCLEKRPADRPRSAREIVRQLEAVANRFGEDAVALRSARRRRTLLVAGLAATCLLALLATWMLHRPH